MRIASIAGLALVLALLSGCITFLSEIHLAADGSGTLVQTVTMNPHAAAAAMEEVAHGMGASGETKASGEKTDDNLFAKTDWSAKAKELGDGVEFVSADRIHTEDTEGVRATYRFRDVAKLSLNPKPGAAIGTEGAGRSAPRAIRFRFERAGARSVLTAVVPPGEREKTADAAPPAAKADPEQIEMIRRMFRGMHIAMNVDVEGAIVSTNASYRDGSRVTLVDLDMDRLLEDPKTLDALNARLSAAAGDDARTAAVLSEFPGVKIETKPEVRIEFAGR